MGVYYACFLAFGVAVPDAKIAALSEGEEAVRTHDWVVQPAHRKKGTGAVFCAPTRLRVNIVNEMVEASDVARGHVLLSEVMGLDRVVRAGWTPDPAAVLPADEAAMLRDLAARAPAVIEPWFIQLCAHGIDAPAFVEHALPVVDGETNEQ